MLGIAYGGKAVMDRLRPHAQTVRLVLGIGVAATALAIAFNLDRHAQTAVPDYVKSIQDRVERSDRAEAALAKVRGQTREAAPGLEDYGEAPTFVGINQWLNTPGERSLSLPGLRGKVVLLDFWTYSCVNCLRTLPHLKAWDRAYRTQGLQIVGVHTPEFAFEHEEDNVRAAIKRLGVKYAVAMDNDFGTWDAYRNRYWPAKYLIDSRGHLRYVHFGEGAYGQTESHIRTLLAERASALPARVRVTDGTPNAMSTPETYLGYQRISPQQFVASSFAPDRFVTYRAPQRPLTLNEFALTGRMRLERERTVAGENAGLTMRFRAQDVYLVLNGQGSVEVRLNGKLQRTVKVDGARLYTLLELPAAREGLLDLRFTPGLSAYAFTFG